MFTTMGKGDQWILVGMIVTLFGYSFYRLRAGKVNLQDIELARKEAKEEAQKSLEL